VADSTIDHGERIEAAALEYMAKLRVQRDAIRGALAAVEAFLKTVADFGGAGGELTELGRERYLRLKSIDEQVAAVWADIVRATSEFAALGVIMKGG
jgi:hypothetical protein